MHADELDRTQMRTCTSRSINAKISVGVLFPTAVLFWDLKKCQNRALPNPVDYYIASFVSISPLKLCYPTQSVVVNTALEIPHNRVNSSSVECNRQVIWTIVQLVQCGLHDGAITIILPFIVHVGWLLELLLCGCFCVMLCFIWWIRAARVIKWILC